MMKQLLRPLYDALRCLNEKGHLCTSKFEINNEEEGLEGDGWLITMLDQTIDELETALNKSNQRKFSLSITHFGSVIAAVPADLWNTDELLIKMIKQIPSKKKNLVFKDTDYTVSLDHVLPYLSLTSKKKYKSCYKLDTKVSLFLRKNGYVCLNKHSITVYDQNRHCKAVFNQDGSCSIEKTKANLDKKLPYRNS